jgi:molecular chaperone GrpE
MSEDKELIIRTESGEGGGSEKSPAENGARVEPETAGTGAANAVPPAVASDVAAAGEKLQAEKRELYERLLRKQAELENFRKRTQREKEDFLQHANADLLRALLPTLDGFERALKQRNSEVPESFYQGMELIYRQLMDVLRRAGLMAIEAEGKLFDPHLHQAVETVESAEGRDQEIVEELQKGYRLKQRLLRPSIVKVAVAPRTQPAAKSSGESAKT